MTTEQLAAQPTIRSRREVERHDTVIIGAGQAGLSVGYHLARRGSDFVILEAGERVGDCWRKRFDSLRLYSPARYDSLPGFRFPAPGWSFPTKDQMADYLEAYADRFGLPVRTEVAVERLLPHGDRYLMRSGEQLFEAHNVVVATGGFQTPIVPSFAAELDPGIRQLHSSDYRNPSQLREGAVLVVGASHSGADIALEVARRGHPTILSGPVRGQIPFRLEGRPARMVMPVLWLLANHVLTVRTPIGRKLQPEVRSHGGPLLRVKLADLVATGVEHTEAKVAGVLDGEPLLEDGRAVQVANVIWCTGFGRDFAWMEGAVVDGDGWPEQKRGAVTSSPGLYFIGLPFLHAFASMLVGGVGRDAGHIAKQITRSAAG